MTLIDTDGIEFLRIRLDYVERELRQIKIRLSTLPLPEPMPFPPAEPRTTPTLHSQHYCNFCGRAQEEVAVLIAGPGPIFICDECVAMCHDIVLRKQLAKPSEDKP